MTLDGEQQELDRLCRAVMEEKDPAKLTELMAALNDFMQRKEQCKLAESKLPKRG